MGTVSEMPAWWKHVILLLLVEGGANTSGGDIPDHQDILRMQDRWKEYRNIVRGGFFFNDSIIVMADYSDGERNSDLVNLQESEQVYESREELSQNDEKLELANDHKEDGKGSRDILKAGFESTLGGMMDALKEIQSKGDFMMDAIKEQKDVLISLRSEVDMAEERLDDALRRTTEMEVKKKMAEKERLMAERDTRMIDNKKEKIETEIKMLEVAKVTTKKDLGSLRMEVGRLRQEMEENGDQMLRLKSGLAPLVTDVSARRSELSKMEKNLEEKAGELEQVQQKIDASSKLLNSIKSSISSPTTPLSDKTGSIQTSSASITSSSLFPVLMVSVLLNLITGGFLLSTYSSSKRRDDTLPAQFIPPAYQDYPEPESEEEKQFGDKMDRLGETYYGNIGDMHEDSNGYFVSEQRFANSNRQDIYYELPRSLYT